MAGRIFDIHLDKHVPKATIPVTEQRHLWFREFMKPYLMVIILYITMYLVRNNFKAAQPLMKQQLGITTQQLGVIGFVFSVVYGIGKIVVGYLVTGKDKKKIASIMLFCSSIVVICIGFLFTLSHVPYGLVDRSMGPEWGLSVRRRPKLRHGDFQLDDKDDVWPIFGCLECFPQYRRRLGWSIRHLVCPNLLRRQGSRDVYRPGCSGASGGNYVLPGRQEPSRGSRVGTLGDDLQ